MKFTSNNYYLCRIKRASFNTVHIFANKEKLMKYSASSARVQKTKHDFKNAQKTKAYLVSSMKLMPRCTCTTNFHDCICDFIQ